MLEKPDLQVHLIISRLQDEYGLQVGQVTFLPLGADVNTAVYRVDTQDKTAYFLKLRKCYFEEIIVTLPLFLKAQGIQPIITALETRAHLFWADMAPYKMILYPYIEGQNGYEVTLSDRQWLEFGAALKGVHAAQLPPDLLSQISPETFSPRWREEVKGFQAQSEQTAFYEPTAQKLAAFMRAKRGEIDALVERADQLGRTLQAQSSKLVLCHSDIHAGNLLLGANDALYIVDWDNPILAPKEHDLMHVGTSTWNSPRVETLFYEGYGQVEIDPAALAYCRCERIIQDIAAFCNQLFLNAAGGEDREQSYQYFTNSFLPNHDVEIALKTDKLG